MRRRLLFSAVGLGFAAFACQVVAGISRVDQVDPPVEAAAPEASPPADGNVPDPCAHLSPPPLPAVDDDPNTSIAPFYIALRTVTLTAPVGAAPLGFDLDGVCTCDRRPGAASDGGQSCVGSTACDGDGGIDNEVATFATGLGAAFDIDKAANINGRIQTGEQTSIVVISKYNGRANDREVAIGLFTSEGIPDTLPAGCPDAGPVVPDSGHFPPGWCGKDKWTVSTSSVAQIGTQFTPNSVGLGYVTNYQFVVRLSGTISVPFAGYRLSLGSPVSSGRLMPLDANLQPLSTTGGGPPKEQIAFWRLDDGILGGRVPVSEMLAAIGTINTPGAPGGTHLCDTPLLFQQVKAEICPRLDVNVTQNLDLTAGAACNAVSSAIGVTGFSVEVQGFVTPLAPNNSCYPDEDGGSPTGGQNVSYRCP